MKKDSFLISIVAAISRCIESGQSCELSVCVPDGYQFQARVTDGILWASYSYRSISGNGSRYRQFSAAIQSVKHLTCVGKSRSDIPIIRDKNGDWQTYSIRERLSERLILKGI